MKEFDQINALDNRLQKELQQLVRIAIWEDFQDGIDLTTLSLVPESAIGSAQIKTRQTGIACGLALLPAIIAEAESRISVDVSLTDGERIEPGMALCTLRGNVRDLLSLERILLNFIGRLCGIATSTGEYAKRTIGSHAQVYDTRKTTPGWRFLEKYAVKCGGGRNHRMGLCDAILIKDNHLAFHTDVNAPPLSPSQAIRAAREFLATWPDAKKASAIIEIEVDNLFQLDDALPERPDIVLLDNMSLENLCQAVQRRNHLAPEVQLEASGGVRLDTIAAIATTGVDRISVGALTHSAINLDIGLDWLD